MDLSLSFEDNGTSHKDIILRWEGREWVCDSYYFRLDQGMLPEKESTEKARLVVCRLLEQWLAALQNVPDGRTVFLPYDFSDQYTGWLKCERSGDSVTISRGWATVEGWSFFPSEISDFINDVSTFRVDGPTESVRIDEVIQAVNRSLAEIRNSS